MHRFTTALLLAATLAVPVLAAEEEIAAKGTIRSVQLYKNGLAVIHQFVPITGPGVYRIDDFASPVHGTLSVRGDLPVSLRETQRMVEEAPSNMADYQQALAGRDVTVYLREPNSPPIKGKVIAPRKPTGDERWNRTYQPPSPYYYYSNWQGNPPLVQPQTLVLRTNTGMEMIDISQIARVSAEGAGTVQRERPILLLSVPEEVKGPGEVEITCLAKGLSWAPSYRVDVLDEKTLAIEQSAVIRNELASLQNADVQLISGFPGVRFAHVISPLSLSQNWTGFFNQVNQRLTEASDLASNSMVAQQARSSSEESAPVLAAEGTDLHYQPVGKWTLAEGDSMQLAVAKAQAPYERIVEWIIADNRNPQGRYLEEHERQRDPEKYSSDPWDSLRFANPLKFPMTTAPASIYIGGQFAGQQLSKWVSPGEGTTLRITKALSIRALSSEQEVQGQREIVWVGNHEYRKAQAKGELSIANHRKTSVKVMVRREFSGEIIAADANPTVKLREAGIWSVNPQNELFWQIQLDPGEQRKLTYTYSVLVYN